MCYLLSKLHCESVDNNNEGKFTYNSYIYKRKCRSSNRRTPFLTEHLRWLLLKVHLVIIITGVTNFEDDKIT